MYRKLTALLAPLTLCVTLFGGVATSVYAEFKYNATMAFNIKACVPHSLGGDDRCISDSLYFPNTNLPWLNQVLWYKIVAYYPKVTPELSMTKSTREDLLKTRYQAYLQQHPNVLNSTNATYVSIMYEKGNIAFVRLMHTAQQIAIPPKALQQLHTPADSSSSKEASATSKSTTASATAPATTGTQHNPASMASDNTRDIKSPPQVVSIATQDHLVTSSMSYPQLPANFNGTASVVKTDYTPFTIATCDNTNQVLPTQETNSNFTEFLNIDLETHQPISYQQLFSNATAQQAFAQYFSYLFAQQLDPEAFASYQGLVSPEFNLARFNQVTTAVLTKYQLPVTNDHEQVMLGDSQQPNFIADNFMFGFEDSKLVLVPKAAFLHQLIADFPEIAKQLTDDSKKQLDPASFFTVAIPYGALYNYLEINLLVRVMGQYPVLK